MSAPVHYASREWLRRHRRAGNRPVGVLPSELGGGRGGLVVDRIRFRHVAGEDPGREMLVKVIGGSPEHPTVMQLKPDELRRVIWAVEAGSARSASATGAESGDRGPGATPWIAGGLLIAAVIGLRAAEKRFA